MPSPFSITAATNSVRLDDRRQGAATFTVFNASGRTLQGRIQIAPLGQAAASWFQADGAPNRAFAIGGTEQIVVSVAVPAAAPPGSYSFRLDMVGVDNPDEDYTAGPVVTFEAAAAAPKKPFPWWIAAVVAVAVIAALAFILTRPRPVAVPALRGQSVGDARAALNAAGLKLGDISEGASDGLAAGLVVASTPAAGAPVARGATVALVVAAQPSPTATPLPQPTPFGGGAGRIAFVSNRDGNLEIYIMNADGSGETNLTRNPDPDFAPAWSPDGAQLAFVSVPSGGQDARLVVAQADGSNPRLVSGSLGYNLAFLTGAGATITTPPSDFPRPAWSPDGKQLVFVAANGQLATVRADGSGVMTLVAAGGSPPSVIYSYPTWSPDGRRIVFAQLDTASGRQDLMVINADGSGLQPLVVNGAYNRDPAWSPDGKRIAFASNVDAGFNEIYVINADGSNQQRLTTNTSDDTVPTWSPDGAFLAYVSSQNASADLSVMAADGSGQIILTENAAEDIDPAWSPDGTRLAYAANRNANPYQVYTMRRDGGEKRLLTESVAGDSAMPAWQP